MIHLIVYSLPQCVYNVSFVPFMSLSLFPFLFLFLDFMGISSTNTHETLLVHLTEPSGLKGLLHMLNATVITMKVS